VQEVHHIAGEDCFLVKARVRDARTLGRLLRERFAASGSVVSTRTTIVLETLQETTSLPIDAALAAARREAAEVNERALVDLFEPAGVAAGEVEDEH
jgi:hypothetical protein